MCWNVKTCWPSLDRPTPQALDGRRYKIAVAFPIFPTLGVALALSLLTSSALGLVTPALAQSPTPTPSQSTALADYDTALRAFRAILAERRAQIDAK